jgi:thiol-disulfide isomerase/thioredoxin
MRRFIKRDWILLGLVLLAAIQAVVLSSRPDVGGTQDDPWFTVGDTLSALHPLDSLGRTASFAGGAPTVLLVFHSECGHCQEVAPLWRAWTGTPANDVRVVAVSSEEPATARAYAAEHDWSTEVWTVSASRLGGPGHTLTSRTPWVFVLDPAGVVLAEGQGSRIAELTAILHGEARGTP